MILLSVTPVTPKNEFLTRAREFFGKRKFFYREYVFLGLQGLQLVKTATTAISSMTYL